ncbi:hypothetical protein [Oceanobacillus saliphilus]|uniref:hypothetical protein n=1 Tax=Oceanobacillus saliphilus TaxID=2925834 RepID=UPI00201E3A59|nr:hypothetical protein [Oceanobacillus saliphilus]
MKRLILLLLVTLSSILVLAACGDNEADADSDENYYSGENIETVIPYDAGGGSDVLGRYVAPFLSDHIAGNPSVQVTNIPGAGSVIGMNEYFGLRDADGYSLIWSSGSTITNHLLGTEGVNYEFSELTPILGVPAGGVVFISADIGYEEPADILNVDPADLVYSGQSATGLDLVPLMSFDVLGLDVQALLGYEGSGPARVAFEQGESSLNYQTTAAYLSSVEPLVENGEAIPLYSFGHFDSDGNIIRDPAFPDLPNLKEFYEEVYGKEPSGEIWDAFEVVASRGFTIQKVLWTKNETPEEAIRLLQEGAENLAADPSFVEDGEDVLGGYEPVVGQELVDLIASIIQPELDPDIEAWIFDYLAENFGE